MEIMRKLDAQIVFPVVPIPLRRQASLIHQNLLACVESTPMELMITRHARLVPLDVLPSVCPDKPKLALASAR